MSSEQFGGIFGKLKGLVFTDEYLAQQAAEAAEQAKQNPPAQTSTPNPTATSSTPQVSVSTASSSELPEQDMLAKVRQLVEKMNKPEIDFLELWNAAEAMGTISENTVANAFVALKIASGNKLSKQTILSSGEAYCTDLKAALDSDIAAKIKQKQQLETQKSQNSSTLSKEVADLNKQIAALQQQLTEKQSKLNNIDADFEPKLADIDRKIVQGQSAVDAVIGEMRQVLAIADKAIQP